MDEVGHGDASSTPEQEGIIEFLKKLDASSINEMYEKWRCICEELEVSLDFVRNEVDPWFQECYQSRKDVRKLNAYVSCEMAERRREELLEKFNEDINLSVSSCDDLVRKMSIRRELETIMNLPPGSWVNRAIECVEKENELMANFRKVRYEAENEEITHQMEQSIQQSASLCLKISQRVNEFCTGVVNYERLDEMRNEIEDSINEFQLVLSKKNDPKKIAASQKKLSDLETEKEQIQEQLEQSVAFISDCLNVLNALLSQSYEKFTQLINNIINHVNIWKRQFQLEYAELAAVPDLNRIAPWCAQVGKQIYDLLTETMPKYSNSLKVFEVDIDSAVKNYKDLLHLFMQQTFVVTEQEHYIVKVDKKHLPKIVVRILAADNFPTHSSPIDVRFLYEEDINNHCYTENVDIYTMEAIPACAEFDNKKKSATVLFQKGKNKRYSEGVFSSLQFKSKFVRPENANSKQVHEEKYRILFTTKINGQTLWTMSLPLVVTTGANQGCLCQASIMWQCFSSDVYKVPIIKTNELKWGQVAEMLQAKVKKLCPDHTLNEDNLNHLRRRLFGKDVDSDIVTLKMFCFDKMTYRNEDDVLNFSFWKWFIGVYNLIDRYLLNFWKEGLIYGFISKEEAKEKLKRCSSGRSGTFFLRFSDQNITDSQGVKSVFAHLTATVLFIKEKDGRKKKCIYDFDVAGHSKLKSKNLANVLMETQLKESSCKVYQFVYPGKKRREDTFDKHCNEETVVAGYTGTKDAFIVDLEQAMCAMEIDTGKHYRSSSIDSGFAPSPQAGECLAAPVKRPRASMEQQHPTIAKMLNNGMFSPSSSPAYSHSSSCPSASPFSAPFSPNFQPGSPAMVNNSPPNSMLHQQALMSPVHNEFGQSQDAMCSSLPTVINDLVDGPIGLSARNCNKTGTLNSVKRSCLVQGTNGRACSTLDGCESGHGCPSLSDGSGSLTPGEQSMEVTISNDDSAPLQNGGSVIYVVQEEGGEYKIVQDQATIGTILQNQSQIAIASQMTEDGLLNIETANQIEVSSISDQKLLLARELLNFKLPDVQKTLQQTVDFNPALESFPDLKITTQPTISTFSNIISSSSDIMMSCPSSTLQTPTLTSAGSMSEAFNFSNCEIAEAGEVNSGTIDIGMFDQALSSGSSLLTNDNTSSGSSFGYGSV